MEALRHPYIIAGCGPGALLHLTRAVEQAVAQSKVLSGAQRLLDLFPECAATKLPFEGSMDAWLKRLAAEHEGPIVVLVSGDPGVSSLSSHVLRRFGRRNCRVIPGISSVQLACSRLGLSWENAAVIRAHGALPDLSLTELSSRDPWVILMGARGAEAFAAKLAAADNRSCIVCDDLSLPTERVEQTSPHLLARLPRHPRRIVVVTRESYHERRNYPTHRAPVWHRSWSWGSRVGHLEGQSAPWNLVPYLYSQGR
jgi:cobalt-precorrin-7 (C5)-methyltransferase